MDEDDYIKATPSSERSSSYREDHIGDQLDDLDENLAKKDAAKSDPLKCDFSDLKFNSESFYNRQFARYTPFAQREIQALLDEDQVILPIAIENNNVSVESLMTV